MKARAAGKIALDPMITHVLMLDDIDRGFVHAGESIRSVVVYQV